MAGKPASFDRQGNREAHGMQEERRSADERRRRQRLESEALAQGGPERKQPVQRHAADVGRERLADAPGLAIVGLSVRDGPLHCIN